MDNIVVVTFTDPSKAYQALSALKALDTSGRLKLHSGVVVERQANGQAVVRDNVDAMDLRGEPKGLIGKLIDGLSGVAVSVDLVDRIPGESTALIAEVSEYAVEVIDVEMGRLGGVVTREATEDVESEFSTLELEREAAWDQKWDEQREADRQKRERERAERHNERLDRVEHWLEGRKDPVAAAAEPGQD